MVETVQLDVGHYVLLAVILVMVIYLIISQIISSKERSELSSKLMARSLTEYTESALRLNHAKSGEVSEEEERKILDDAMRKDRMPV